MYRLFVALEFSDSVKDALSALPGDLPGAIWVDTDALHLTVRFIGEVTPAKMRAIQESLHTVELPSFFIHLSGLGLFPLRGQPEVMWMGIETPNQGLQRLRHRVDSALNRVQIGAEGRKFHPHVTLAGVKGCEPRWLGHYLANQGMQQIKSVAIEQFVLFSSTRAPGGAIYTEIDRYPLKGMLSSEDREELEWDSD